MTLTALGSQELQTDGKNQVQGKQKGGAWYLGCYCEASWVPLVLFFASFLLATKEMKGI
jgi:hypothetical protein